MGGYAIAAGAVLGGIGGAMKSGPKFNLSAYGQQAQGYSQDALSAYRNLVGVGPGAGDITAALDATRSYANTLQNTASGGLYNQQMGNQLAEQQFGGQRLQMEQNFQDQLAQANRAAAMAGRSGNDPILRARLAQEQTRQQALLQANQSSAAVDLGRQYTTDSLNLQGQAVNALGGLASQAYGNQQNLFNMSNQAYQTEFSQGMQQAQYEQSRGGGLKGALTGIVQGAGTGMQMAQGMSAMNANNAIAQQAQQQNPLMQGFQFGAASAGTQAAMGGFGQLAGINGVAQPNYASYAAPQQVQQQSAYGVPSFLAPNSGQYASAPSGQFALASSRNTPSMPMYLGGGNSFMYK